MTKYIKEAKALLDSPYCIAPGPEAETAIPIIRGLLAEIIDLKIQVCDRGNSFQKVTEENKQLCATLKEVSGCHKEHDTPKLCAGCLLLISDTLGGE